MGPLLFTLYINDIANVSDIISPLIFVDDTNVFVTGKDLNHMVDIINKELNKLTEWMNVNKLSLNVTKTNFIFRSKHRKAVFSNNIKINGTDIDSVESTKYLGVYIDSELNWSKHINFIKGKIAKAIGIICKARTNLNRETLLVLYYSFVYPYLQYCIEVWGRTSNVHLLPLFRLQKKKIRIISFSNRKANTYGIFKSLKLLNSDNIYLYKVLIFMYKYNQQLLPGIFLNMFNRNDDFHQYNTRQQFFLREPIIKTELMRKTVRFTGVSLLNIVKQKINFDCSFVTFKYHLRKYLMNNDVNG